MENLTTNAYLIYLPITVLLTLYVAHKLFRNAKVFMLDIFKGKEDIANATNKLFEIGFYLLNIGFAFMVMHIGRAVENKQDLLEVLAEKLGGFSIYLGVMLFLNMFLFFRGRKKARAPKPTPAPVTYRTASRGPNPNNPTR